MDKKINTIDLFAGCGGLMDGFEKSNFYDTLACVEWEKSPCENLKKRLKEKWNYNNANEIVMRFDIQRTQELFSGWKNDIEYGNGKGLDNLIGDNKIDVIIGGPPCQAYSIAGRIRDKDGMKNDYRNYLFESYLKVVNRYKPKFFVFENVPGILSASPDGEPIIERIKKRFDECGYTILDNLKKAIIDVSEYGVPQNRKRIIILGVSKKYFGEKKANIIVNEFYNKYLNRYKTKKMTVKEAIGDLPKLLPTDEYRKEGKKYSHLFEEYKIANHIPRFHSERDKKIFYLLEKDISDGTNFYNSTEKLKELYYQQTGKKSNVHKYYVLRWDEQSNTIPAHLYKDGLRHIHPDPEQARSITVREAARLQSFDDDYEFIGSMMDQYKMIGNAVPPKFSNAIAKAIKDIFNDYVG
jgi:DNA (cytosine-5)-methyltransferase 1